MAWDRTTTEYHLTLNGWVRGTEHIFSNRVGAEVERPRNAVEIWEHRMVHPSGWAQEEHTWRMVWHDASLPKDERDTLRARFEEHPFDMPRRAKTAPVGLLVQRLEPAAE